MKIEFIYDNSCPNVEQTRKNLKQALETCGLPPQWTEWEQSNPGSPGYVQNNGSPTILVEGKDLISNKGSNSECCRIYEKEGRIQGVPPLEQIIEAIRDNRKTFSSWFTRMAALPALGLSLLPVGLCPACWPIYGGLISALGVGFLLDVNYLLPIMILFFAGAIGSLFYQAGSRQGMGPGIIGLVSACIIFGGKFWFDSIRLSWSDTPDDCFNLESVAYKKGLFMRIEYDPKINNIIGKR